MKFKWNKGLLFPYLMLFGSFSINVNTVQTENSNHLVLVNNNNTIENNIEKLPARETQAGSDVSFTEIQNAINYSFEANNVSDISTNIHLNLLFLTLSLFVICLTSSVLKENLHKINLNSILKLKKHFNYLSYWDFQSYFFNLNNNKNKQRNIKNLERNKINNISIQVSFIHHITSA